MLEIIAEQLKIILEIGYSKIGDKYEKGYNCVSFVCEIYEKVNISCDFYEHPLLTLEDIYKKEYLGYLCFLKHKKHGLDKRFTHVGIIAPDHQLFHYSRYFGEPNVREVFLTHFTKIFEVYNFAMPDFSNNKIQEKIIN